MNKTTTSPRKILATLALGLVVGIPTFGIVFGSDPAPIIPDRAEIVCNHGGIPAPCPGH